MVTSKRTTEYLRGLLHKNDALEIKGITGRDAAFPMLPAESMQLLRLLVAKAQPKKILEVGTNIGASGIIMLKSAPQAKLYTIEMDPDTARQAKENMKQNGVHDRATVYIGMAEEILPYMTGEYDFIFLDGPKGQYSKLCEYLIPLLAVGGTLVCDNVLFRGMVTGDRRPTARKITLSKKLDAFLRQLSSNEKLITSVIPIGDGMSISLKIKK